MFSVGRGLVERSRQKFNSVRNNGVKRWPASVLGPIRLYTISWESKHLPTIPNETRQALMRSRLPADTQMPSSPREAFPSITVLRVFPPPPFRFSLPFSLTILLLNCSPILSRCSFKNAVQPGFYRSPRVQERISDRSSPVINPILRSRNFFYRIFKERISRR